MKQTVEEAAKDYYDINKIHLSKYMFRQRIIDIFTAGAEWQKRQRIELFVSTLENTDHGIANFEKKNELPETIFLQSHGDSECVDNIRRKSPWIRVNEQLPKTDGYFLVTDGEIFAVAYFFKCWGKFAKCKEYPHPLYDDGVVKLYMQIPSFDEILEANRDVLERIKEKGD